MNRTDYIVDMLLETGALPPGFDDFGFPDQPARSGYNDSKKFIDKLKADLRSKGIRARLDGEYLFAQGPQIGLWDQKTSTAVLARPVLTITVMGRYTGNVSVTVRFDKVTGDRDAFLKALTGSYFKAHPAPGVLTVFDHDERGGSINLGKVRHAEEIFKKDVIGNLKRTIKSRKGKHAPPSRLSALIAAGPTPDFKLTLKTKGMIKSFVDKKVADGEIKSLADVKEVVASTLKRINKVVPDHELAEYVRFAVGYAKRKKGL